MTNQEQNIAVAEACGHRWIWRWKTDGSLQNRPIRYLILSLPTEGYDYNPDSNCQKRMKGLFGEETLATEEEVRMCREKEYRIADYGTDLNAMHEAAMWLRVNKPLEYVKYTATITSVVAQFNSDLEDQFSISAHDATSTQRREAFLKALGLWKD